jgi:hypothetical protein
MASCRSNLSFEGYGRTLSRTHCGPFPRQPTGKLAIPLRPGRSSTSRVSSGSVASRAHRPRKMSSRSRPRVKRERHPLNREDRNLTSDRRDDAIPQRADVIGDGLPVAEPGSVEVRFCIIALVSRDNSPTHIDDQRDSSVAALVLGRHVGCVRAGLPKSNRRQLTWLHAGMDKMLEHRFGPTNG